MNQVQTGGLRGLSIKWRYQMEKQNSVKTINELLDEVRSNCVQRMAALG